MDSKIIERKPEIQKGDEVLIDLTSPSLRYNEDTIPILDAFYVGEDMVMRADLLSHAAYGNVEGWELLLKYNSISNPFAIQQGDFILIPELSAMEDSLVDTTKDKSEEDIRSQYVDVNKKSTIDPKLKEYQDFIQKLRKTSPAVFSSGLPPNISQVGDKEASLIDAGVLALGNNITR